MKTAQDLRNLLIRLDQRSYKAYKDIQGEYRFPDFTLLIDHVQGDPFASPSRLRVKCSQAIAEFPPELYGSPSRAIALRDYLTRQFSKATTTLRAKRGSGNSGLMAIAPTGQQVLDRTTVFVTPQQVEARFVVGLPARGRQVLGYEAMELLCEDLPQIVQRALKYSSLNPKAVQHHVETVEDADWLRNQLEARGLIAFIPDGAILPRQSGIEDRPLQTEAIPFTAPDALRVTFDRPNQGSITGMGIPTGVTVIVGGGYHGKSTLLKAIALGIYNHIPGDGREAVATHAAAVKIRAEDGRSIVGVNISPFINHLPQGKSTTQFSSENASGSTSQAANIIEALEAGARVLLVDEDTSATNFMIRDRRMQALIAKDKEPITPFLDKIRQLYTDYGVSTVLVMGGSGDYFDVADTVIAMTDFQPQDVTEQARAIAQQYGSDRTPEGGQGFGLITPRIVKAKRLDSPDRKRGGRWGDRGKGRESSDGEVESSTLRSPRLKVRDVDEMVFGAEVIDLSAVEQLVEVGQLRGIGEAIAYLQQHYLNSQRTLPDLLKAVESDIARAGLDCLTSYSQGDLAMFRPLELAAVLNRLRSLEILPETKNSYPKSAMPGEVNADGCS